MAILIKKEPKVGIEPTTHALRKRCSTPELHRLGDVLSTSPLVYG